MHCPLPRPCFNPRSREGSDVLDKFDADQAVDVSIHAPVKGATQSIPAFRVFSLVSIHAPVKGATLVETRRAEEVRVSIHAPVKGATRIVVDFHTSPLVSIHAPVKGATVRTAISHLA